MTISFLWLQYRLMDVSCQGLFCPKRKKPSRNGRSGTVLDKLQRGTPGHRLESVDEIAHLVEPAQPRRLRHRVSRLEQLHALADARKLGIGDHHRLKAGGLGGCQLRDGKKVTDMDMNLLEKLAIKKALGKIEGTDIEKLLKEYKAI